MSHLVGNLCNKEIKYIKDNKKNYNLYSEPSNDKKTFWAFLGNTQIKKSEILPMFEVVLFQTNNTKPTSWRPHIQIDYDTNNTYEELAMLSHKYFKKNIFTWKLNIPNYGIVLAMGCVGVIGDVKIMLGCGTHLRDTYYHRKNLIKK